MRETYSLRMTETSYFVHSIYLLFEHLLSAKTVFLPTGLQSSQGTETYIGNCSTV